MVNEAFHLYNFVSSKILLHMFDSVIKHILYHNFYEKNDSSYGNRSLKRFYICHVFIRWETCLFNKSIDDFIMCKKRVLYGNQEYQNGMHSLRMQGKNNTGINNNRKKITDCASQIFWFLLWLNFWALSWSKITGKHAFLIMQPLLHPC